MGLPVIVLRYFDVLLFMYGPPIHFFSTHTPGTRTQDKLVTPVPGVPGTAIPSAAISASTYRIL